MKSYSLSARLRYYFDNAMARGVSAQILLLAIATGIIILAGTILVVAAGVEQSGGFFPSLWTGLLHVVDNGNISNDSGNKFYVFVMLLVTVGGLTVLAALFGIITNGIDAKMEQLRRGHSRVLERGHTLILGWSPQIFQIISELMVANENQRKARIVVLSDQDKPEMEAEIRARVKQRGRTRVICRSGNPLDLTELEIANPQAARSIIILPPEAEDPDTYIVKTLLAITHHPQRRPEPYHIVAPIRDQRNLEVARMASRGEGQIVLGHDLISRITVQTCRQSGLSVVYTELLDFDGDEIYFQEEPKLVGKTFGDALFAYEDSAVMGLCRADGTTLVNPSMDTVIAAGDKVIAVTEDDDTLVVSNGTGFDIVEDAIRLLEPPPPEPERTLIFNWNSRTPAILTELDSYVAPGSVATVLVRDAEGLGELEGIRGRLQRLHVDLVQGDPTDRETLEGLDIAGYNHVIVLGEFDSLDAQEADARTLTTLLHLRSLQERVEARALAAAGASAGATPAVMPPERTARFSVVSEMADLRNRELASATRADDFIVSDQLVSLMLSQLSENRDLQPVFDDLFDPEGSEIYLKPARYYIEPGRPVNFYTVIESARRRGHVAIGYRIQSRADDPKAQYGITVNPKKSETITFSEDDLLIVVAED